MQNRLIIVPTFNELANAPILIERIFKHIANSHILIIDDGSPDKTGEKIKEIQSKYPATLFLLERASKSGLGSAYRTGFAWGLERGYEELIEMDADLSHRVRDLKKMIEAKELQPNTDLVIGSRWVPGGRLRIGLRAESFYQGLQISMLERCWVWELKTQRQDFASTPHRFLKN